MLQQILKSRQLLEVKLNAEGIYYRDTPCPPKKQKNKINPTTHPQPNQKTPPKKQ